MGTDTNKFSDYGSMQIIKENEIRLSIMIGLHYLRPEELYDDNTESETMSLS